MTSDSKLASKAQLACIFCECASRRSGCSCANGARIRRAGWMCGYPREEQRKRSDRSGSRRIIVSLSSSSSSSCILSKVATRFITRSPSFGTNNNAAANHTHRATQGRSRRKKRMQRVRGADAAACSRHPQLSNSNIWTHLSALALFCPNCCTDHTPRH